MDEADLTEENILETCSENVYKNLSAISILFSNSITGLVDLKRKSIKKNLREIKELNKEVKILKNNIYMTIYKLKEDEIESGHHYVQVIDYLRETAHCLTFIAEPVAQYIENNHAPLNKDQQEDLHQLSEYINNYFSKAIQSIKHSDFSKINKLNEIQQALLDEITRMKKMQLKRIKKGETGTKNSELVLNTLTETKNLMLYTLNLYKAQRDFVNHKNNYSKSVKVPEAESAMVQDSDQSI
jgi:Na+/phosphate symporter